MSVEILAEISGNAFGNFEVARSLVKAAHEAGADAIKTQCFNPETLTIDYDGPNFVIESGVWKGRRLIDLYRETTLPWDWQAVLFDQAQSLGMGAVASVFCKASCDYIANLNPTALKIASLEITDTPLIEYAASKGFPLIISCGMASIQEINAARIAADEASGLTLLHCPPGYPASILDANLLNIEEMSHRFGVPCGLSDHTLSTSLPAIAVGMGATMIEKHIILSRDKGGADASFSLEPDEFEIMADACREAAMAIKLHLPDIPPIASTLRRSVYVVEDIEKGDEFTEQNIRSIRPGGGLDPWEYPFVLGKVATEKLSRGTPLTEEHFE
jgi:pseudaminic acid synthase